MKHIFALLALIFVFSSCEKQDLRPYPCPDGNCNFTFFVDTIVSPGSYTDSNGYIRVKHVGLNYFTIQGYLEELDPYYVVNEVPLIETQYDSDYWVIFDTISWTLPTYSYMGWFTDRQFQVPFPIGNRTYTLTEVASVMPPLNIVGYAIQKNMCMDCPYTPTLLGTYSKYNYTPRQQIFFDNEIIGDTAQIFVRVLFNNDSGPRVTKDTTFNVIFE
jgi:hypothetical protein